MVACVYFPPVHASECSDGWGWLVFGACCAPSKKYQDGICSVLPPWFFHLWFTWLFLPLLLLEISLVQVCNAARHALKWCKKWKQEPDFFDVFAFCHWLESLIRNRFRRIVMCLWLYIVMMSCPFAVLVVSKPPHASSTSVSAQTFLIKCPFEEGTEVFWQARFFVFSICNFVKCFQSNNYVFTFSRVFFLNGE